MRIDEGRIFTGDILISYTLGMQVGTYKGKG